MDNTRLLDQHVAPLAFSLSVRSEAVLPALYNNALNTTHMKVYPVLLSLASGVAAGAAVLAFGLPSWVAVPAAVLGAYVSLKPFKRYFDEAYVNGRVAAIRGELTKGFSSQDAQNLAHIATGILTSHYGKQEWATRILAQYREGQLDPIQFLSTAFAYAPDMWQMCSRNVYARTLAGVVPADAKREASAQ